MRIINKKYFGVVISAFITTIFLLALKHSQGENMSNWKILSIFTLDDCKGYDFNDMSFIDKNNGVLVGEYRDGNALFTKDVHTFVTKSNSVILQTTDGGDTWKQIYKSNGGIYSVSQISKEVFFALKIVYQGEDYQEQSHIIKYQNDLNKLEEINIINKPIRKILFFSSDIGLLIGYKNQQKTSTEIMITKDGGKNWETLALRSNPNIGGPVIKYNNSSILYTIKDKLVLYNLNSREESFVELPEIRLSIESICLDNEKKLWLLGRTSQNAIILYKQDNGGGFEKFALNGIKDEKLSPLRVHVYNNNIVIFFVDTKSSFFPRWKVFRSVDNGISWSEEKLPIMMAEYILSFYQSDYIWVLAPNCKLQHRS